MSAIFGIIHWNGEPASPDDLARMNNALAAHGTDGGGIWVHANAGLGQRLMCFTPEDAHEKQPLVSADGRCVLVSDGRIDNRDDLMADLGLPLHGRADSPCESPITDGELFLRAYKAWGTDCAAHIVGAFVFAVWDERLQRLFICQPRFGQRSLVYYSTSRMVAFATMSSALLALPDIPREIDLESIADYLARAPREPGSSFHRGLRRLDNSHWLIAQRDGVTVRRHWQPDLRRELRLRRDEDYVEAFNDVFERAVAAQLRSATPVGVMMSGGFDSTSIAALAAESLGRRGERLATFTEVPRYGFAGPVIKGRYADETPFVQAMARRYANLDLNPVHTDGRFFLEDLEQFFAWAEAPFRNASNLPWYEAIVRAAGQQNVRVLFEGGAGNLTISWNGSGLLPQLLRSGEFKRALREAGGWRALAGQGILPLLPAPLWTTIQRARRRMDADVQTRPPWHAVSVICLRFARRQHVEERARARGHDWLYRMPIDTRRLRYETLTQLPNGASDIAAGFRARYGVDQRGPAGDLRLFQFCLSLPEEQYLRAGQSRRLIRRAMADRLPGEILNNKLRGLQSADWFERMVNARPAIFEELAGMERCELARQAIDLARMRDLLERMTRPAGDVHRVLMDYRMAFESGLMMGRFLRRLESGA